MFSAADAQRPTREHPNPRPGHIAHDSHPSPEKMIDKLIEKVNEKEALSEETQASMKVILTDFHSKMKDKPEDRKAVKDERDQKMKALLTDKQYIAYLEVQLEHRDHMRGKHRGHGGERFIQALDEKVSLTDTEKDQLKQIFEEFRTAVKENPEGHKEAATVRDDKVKALLSEEKYTAYKELKAEMKKKHKQKRK